jgi:hypothetical protein
MSRAVENSMALIAGAVEKIAILLEEKVETGVAAKLSLPG